jgi:hypothetical protein
MSNESSSEEGDMDARSDATLSGSSESGTDDDVNSRRLRAMCQAIHRMDEEVSEETRAEIMSQPVGSGWRQDEARNAADIASISKLLEELAGFMDLDRCYKLSKPDSEKLRQEDLVRAREILSSSNPPVDLNIKVLEYGQTLLSGSVSHSTAMLKLLLEHGADPNLENDMGGETAFDKVEEWLEEYEDNAEYLEMKQALLEKGAVCFEDRMANL